MGSRYVSYLRFFRKEYLYLTSSQSGEDLVGLKLNTGNQRWEGAQYKVIEKLKG